MSTLPAFSQRLDTRSATNPSTSSVQIASAARDHTSTVRTARRDWLHSRKIAMLRPSSIRFTRKR